jgi:mannose/fructose/N-acetylgalactosamine-specific phosphotransferase system component IID
VKPMRHIGSRARRAIRAAHAAQVVLGIAVALAVAGSWAGAIGAIVIAAALTTIALLWALKQEDHRGS